MSRVVSSHFPYINMHVQVHQRDDDLEALLDTGFAGHLAVPRGFVSNGHPPDSYTPWILADGSEVLAATYRGTVSVGALGPYPAAIIALGDQTIVGRRITDRFTVILDHGRQVIIEP